MSRGHEYLPGPDGNLRVAISTLQMVFDQSSFPREFVPPENWASAIQVQTPEVFDEAFVTFLKGDKHPFTWEELKRIDPNIENTLAQQIQTVRARVDFDGFQEPHVVIRKLPGFESTSPGVIFWVLAHEVGHLASRKIEETLSAPEVEDLQGQLRVVEESGYGVDRSQLRLRRQGNNRFITLEGKRLFMFPTLGKYYGTFLDEFYADIYRLYISAHLIKMRLGVSLETAISTIKSFPFSDSNEEKTYYLKTIEYAEEVGWDGLIRAGISSDPDEFLRGKTEKSGEEEHRRVLDELQSLRSTFCVFL